MINQAFEIIIHASGSSGNAYTIRDGKSKILIDPGMRYKVLQLKTNFSLSFYDFVLLSHEHGDHSMAIPNLLQLGKVCYMSTGTRNALGLMHSSAIEATPETTIKHKNWMVLPFKTEHDSAEPLGFMIKSPSGKKIIYAVDTYGINYTFKGITHYMIECNHSEDLLMANDRLTGEVKDRIKNNHLNIERVKRFFKKQDLSKTERIYLLHLSDDNSDEDKFIKQITNITNKPVIVA